MSSKFLAGFSNTGRFFAQVSDAGKLRIWDVNACTLKQEYTPDVHLTSPFTDLRWIITTKKVELGSGSRKRKAQNVSTEPENEYLLLGSRSSDIFLYSVSSYSIVSTFKNGHTSRINGIAWCRSVPDIFYTCSDDHYVVQWSIANSSMKQKWCVGGKISCIALTDEGTSVVTAKREIQWWDLSNDKGTILKTFKGHSTDVQSLVFVKICNEPCVLSAAKENRFVCAWLLNGDSEDRGALATFAMDDASISLTVHSLLSGSVSMLAGSRTGVLQMYHCTKNGKKHVKPIKAKLSIQIAASSDQEEKTQVDQIPIIGAAFSDENSAYIAYGSEILSFEKLDLNSTEKCMFIVREDPRKKSSVRKEEIVNKILPTSSCKNVHYVPSEAVNGYLTSGNVKKPSKRNNTGEKNNDVPLERRLENLIVEVPSTASVPTTDSLVHLLLQGLKSKDSRLLIDVIENKEDNVIKTTISRLPVEAVLPFSVELISLLQGRRPDCDSAVKWLRCILTIHGAQLISNPEVTEVFAPIFPFIESRLNLVGPLYRLVGRLDMMVEQIKHRNDESERSLQNVSLQPKYIYQDEDSDEEDEENEVTREEDAESNEDSDDHWEEMSEIDSDSAQEHAEDVDMDEG